MTLLPIVSIKYSTIILSLVINKVKILKTCKQKQKCTLALTSCIYANVLVNATQKTIIFVVNWISSCHSFLRERLHSSYIYFHCSYLYMCTIITLEPCALDAEFQHFIPRFNKISLILWIPLKEGFGVKGGPKTGWLFRMGFALNIL